MNRITYSLFNLLFILILGYFFIDFAHAQTPTTGQNVCIPLSATNCRLNPNPCSSIFSGRECKISAERAWCCPSGVNPPDRLISPTLIPSTTPVPTKSVSTSCIPLGVQGACSPFDCLIHSGTECKKDKSAYHTKWCCPSNVEPPVAEPPEPGCRMGSYACYNPLACRNPNDKPRCISQDYFVNGQTLNAYWCCPLPLKPPPEPGCVQIEKNCNAAYGTEDIFNGRAYLLCPSGKQKCVTTQSKEYWCCPGQASVRNILPDVPGLTCGSYDNGPLSLLGNRCCQTYDSDIKAAIEGTEAELKFGCFLFEGLCVSNGIKGILNIVTGGGNEYSKKTINFLYKYDQMFQRQCYSGEAKYSSAGGTLSCTCVPRGDKGQFCEQYLQHSPREKDDCNKCIHDTKGVWTAIGCVETSFERFIGQTVLSVMLGLGGVISLVCIIYAAITIQTSRGDAEKIKTARERLTSCIVGLIMIIFSIFILRVIGVDLLGIPGFG